MSTETARIPAPKNEASIGVAEAATYLDVPRSWLYAKVESPNCDLPYHRMGRYLKFLVSELNTYREKNRGGSRS